MSLIRLLMFFGSGLMMFGGWFGLVLRKMGLSFSFLKDLQESFGRLRVTSRKFTQKKTKEMCVWNNTHPTHAFIGRVSLSLRVQRHGWRHSWEYRESDDVMKTQMASFIFLLQHMDVQAILNLLNTVIHPWIPVHSSMPCTNPGTGMLLTKQCSGLKDIGLVLFSLVWTSLKMLTSFEHWKQKMIEEQRTKWLSFEESVLAAGFTFWDHLSYWTIHDVVFKEQFFQT